MHPPIEAEPLLNVRIELPSLTVQRQATPPSTHQAIVNLIAHNSHGERLAAFDGQCASVRRQTFTTG